MTTRSMRMNALSAAALLLAMILLLAACGGNDGAGENDATADSGGTNPPSATEEPIDGDEAESRDETEGQEAGSGKVSGEDKDLFLKIAMDSANLASYKVSMSTKQQMELNGDTIATDSEVEMTAVMKPTLAFHQLMTTNSDMGVQESESYLLQDGFYMKDPSSGTWLKYPSELSAQLAPSADSNPAEMLENMIDFADDLVIAEEGGNYVVSLTATEGDLGKLLGGTEGTVGAMEAHSLEYRIVVDKSTHYPLSMDMKMDMTVGEGEYKSRVVSETSAVYSEHNGIDEIKVPAEVLEAQSLLAPAE